MPNRIQEMVIHQTIHPSGFNYDIYFQSGGRCGVRRNITTNNWDWQSCWLMGLPWAVVTDSRQRQESIQPWFPYFLLSSIPFLISFFSHLFFISFPVAEKIEANTVTLIDELVWGHDVNCDVTYSSWAEVEETFFWVLVDHSNFPVWLQGWASSC